MAVLLFAFVAAAAPACHAVRADQIFVSDLAAADARFAPAPGDAVVGYSPEPGARRVFYPAELAKLAARYQIASTDAWAGVCFERESRVLTEPELMPAIRAIAPADAKIEILAHTNSRVPVGNVQFVAAPHARPDADGAVLLRGYVVYGNQRRFAIWAKTRFTVRRKVLVAAVEIPAGSAVGDAQVRIEERDAGIEAERFIPDASHAVGRLAIRRIPAGAVVTTDWVEPPKQVNAGATVTVEVHDGAAKLKFEGLAQTAGRTGEMVTVRNPASGRAFRAKVTGLNVVLVVPAGAN